MCVSFFLALTPKETFPLQNGETPKTKSFVVVRFHMEKLTCSGCRKSLKPSMFSSMLHNNNNKKPSKSSRNNASVAKIMDIFEYFARAPSSGTFFVSCTCFVHVLKFYVSCFSFLFLDAKNGKNWSKSSAANKDVVFSFENSTFGPRWTMGLGTAFMFFTSLFSFPLSIFEQSCFLFLVFLSIFSLLALLSEFNCGCFLRCRCFMEMWCPDDIGRDSWDWVGPPAWEESMLQFLRVGWRLLACQNGASPD